MKKVQTTVPAFAKAMTSTTTNVEAAFDTVQRTYIDAEVLNYAADYAEGKQTNPDTLGNNWLPPATIKARHQVLDALKEYASQLNTLTVTDCHADAEATELSKSLKDIAGDKHISGIAKSDPDAGAQVSTAIDALADWLIQEKLRKELPAYINKMDPNIQKISNLLILDIGSVNTDPEHPSRGSGLRQELWIEYDKQIFTWDGYVRHNYLDKSVSPDLKLNAIKQIAVLVQQKKAADDCLKQVATTLRQMAKAHAELVKAANAKQDLQADLNGLIAEGQRLGSYYESLGNKK
jgi:hypothetical protein